MKKLKREIADFYKKIFSNAVFKNKIQEKAKKIVTEKDLRNLIREEIMPLIKKENLNYSEEDLLKYEEETLKSLSKEDLANVSGGLSFKSALWAGGILSMALFGSLNANAMDVEPFVSNPQQTRGNSQQQNNSNNNNSNANQPGNNGNNNNGDGNNAANNPDRARAWRNTLYGLLNKLPQRVQKWASPLIEKGLIVSDGNYLFLRNKSGSVLPLLLPEVTVFVFPPMVWDVNENVYHAERVNLFVGVGASEFAKITEFIADPRVKNLTIARRYFANNKTLKSVDLRSVENLIIEEGAFDGCENLVELILPENPTNVSIKENAFAGCSALDKTLLVEKYGYVEPYANINNDNDINKPDNDGDNNNNVAIDALQHQDRNGGNHAANKPAPQNRNNGNNVATSNKDNSKDVSNNVTNNENKNDASDQHNDNSNNNESVEEYNDEDYYVDIDEIMASQKREFGENPEMRTFDRNVAIDMANGKIPCICKNANGKIIFVIPIWCDTIEENSFRVDNLVYPDSPKEKNERALLRKIANSVEILVVPPNVKEIGYKAFSGWPNLKKIIFIDGWPDLNSNRSFDDCSQLRKVESIGDSSKRPDILLSGNGGNPFIGCENLEEIIIADNVIYKRSIAADENDNKYGKKLKKISMPKRARINFNESYIIDTFIPFISIEELYFPIGSSCENFRIKNWNKLEKLDIPFVFSGLNPSGSTWIYKHNEYKLLIENCDSLKKINIRGDVRAINVMTSDYLNNVVSIIKCPKLEEVTFPPSLEYVGGNFDNLIEEGCPNLKKITFLSERIYFGENFFSLGDTFSSAYFPKKLKIYLPYAKEIYVGDKKYDIPNDNPDNAIEIVEVDYNEKDNYDEKVRIIEDSYEYSFVFQKVLDRKDAELMLNGSIPGYDEETGLLKIPEYYCEIVERAFKNNSSIKNVAIPYSVKEIGKEAFANCDNLGWVAVEHRIPNFGNKAFDACSNLEGVMAGEENSKKTTPEQNLSEVFSNCPNFKGIKIPGGEGEGNGAFVTIYQVKSWNGKNFGKIIIPRGNVWFEKGFFSSEYFPEGFKIYLPDSKEICVDCEKIPITKEDNSSKDNSDEEDNFQYKVGEKIPLPENISNSGVISEEEEEEEALEKGIILIKTNSEKEKGLNPASNPVLKYGWQIESYSD